MDRTTARSYAAAKSLGNLCGWQLTNLKMQKLMYFAHMIHLGMTNGQPLVSENFQAWNYGPVLPSLYYKLRGFGNSPVKDVFFEVNPVTQGTAFAAISSAVEQLNDYTPAELVSITHRKGGAWDRYYQPGTTAIQIPNQAILEEILPK